MPVHVTPVSLLSVERCFPPLTEGEQSEQEGGEAWDALKCSSLQQGEVLSQDRSQAMQEQRRPVS